MTPPSRAVADSEERRFPACDTVLALFGLGRLRLAIFGRTVDTIEYDRVKPLAPCLFRQEKRLVSQVQAARSAFPTYVIIQIVFPERNQLRQAVEVHQIFIYRQISEHLEVPGRLDRLVKFQRLIRQSVPVCGGAHRR